MIDLSAREPHFLDHLAPVWRRIPLEERGKVYVGAERTAERAVELRLGAVRIGYPPRTGDGAVIVSAAGDLKIVSRGRRRIALFEHGAGQTYGNRHSSYAGGSGRGRVDVFLCTSEAVARFNRRSYPTKPALVIGSPRVDELAAIPRVSSSSPTVAISFHWRADRIAPEAGTVLDEYLPHLADQVAELERAGVEVIGHAHPRIAEELGPLWRELGVEFVEHFDDVVARADAYAVDNSSTLFEFAALGRPVVVLNGEKYRRSVKFGLRFWTEADVGRNVDRPDDLAAGILEALEDGPELRRSREAAVARVYSVADGTSAARGALAVRSLAARRCLVCGASHASCGPTSDVEPVDAPDSYLEEGSRVSGLKRYPNPDRPGAFLRLSEADARRRGLTEAPEAPSSPAKAVEEPLVEDVDQVPAGALRPGGPTHRARSAADKKRSSPAPADEAEDDEPKDKKTEAPAPARTRRRRKVDDDAPAED